MSQVIRISDALYRRLEAHASGFDSPSNVIENILNDYEKRNPGLTSQADTQKVLEVKPAASLEISYSDGSEEDFKRQLLKNKKAYIKLYYTNGTTEIKEWKAFRFNASSSVDGNLRSGYLRGWRENGIFKADLSVYGNEV